MPPDEFLTVKELAAELKVPVNTIYKWNTKGTAPKRIRVGRSIRYRRADVNRWTTTRAA